jgi:hypothetical protein
MQIVRLLVLSSLAAASVATASAQSSPDNNRVPSPPKTYSFVPHQNLRLQAPSLSQSQQLGFTPFDFHTSKEAKPLSLVFPQPKPHIILPQSKSQCYSIRSYRFNRDNPASDSTDFAEYSTCQAADNFQVKAVLEVHPR